METPMLAMRGIVKRFSGVQVLHGVDLTLRAGEVLALMGENGAGKSTLMKILNGDYVRDGGEILLNGQATHFRSPRDAENAGVRVIYQELNYASDLSVTENILLGRWPRKNGVLGKLSVDWKRAHETAAQILASLQAEISPHELVGNLSVGQQQLVEIAKALSSRARVLVMDEPTAALTSREVHRLFGTIEQLRAQGVGIVYISHRLDEVEKVAQRVAVLRDGRAVGEVAMQDVSRRDIVRMMVGHEVESSSGESTSQSGKTVLNVDKLGARGLFDDVSFSVEAGEIVGLYGLLGAGQMDVLRALFGAPEATSGTVTVGGQRVELKSPAVAKKSGIGLVPEDRKREGLVLGMSVGENLTLGNWNSVAHNGVFQHQRARARIEHWMKTLGVRASGPEQIVGTLSGGNQQKVVLARWLEANTRVLLLAEPTRGVDVGAREEIYAALRELRREGLALVLVSTDMEEVLALCDRVLVFAKGRVVREFSRAGASQEALLSAASGEE